MILVLASLLCFIIIIHKPRIKLFNITYVNTPNTRKNIKSKTFCKFKYEKVSSVTKNNL